MADKWTIKDYGEPEYLDGAQAQYAIHVNATNANEWQPIGYIFSHDNALKTAAAPEMYDALKIMIHEIEWHRDAGLIHLQGMAAKNLANAKAILAKAEGREG